MRGLPVATVTAVLAMAVVAAPAAAGAVPASAPASSTAQDIRVDFDDVGGPVGTPVTTVTVLGAQATGVVVAQNGGLVTTAVDRDGQAQAVALPAFDPVSSTRAVIRLTNDGAVDQFNPGTRNFRFGVEFVLDAVSSQPGTNDDGDNLVQRGLYDAADQYKLQVDGRHPSCRLKGAVGGARASVTVTSPVTVDSSRWYGATCLRVGRTLSVIVTVYNDDGTSATTTTSRRSTATIDVTMNASTIPVSIGGKLYADGTIVADTDQFNGRVDNVFLQIA